MDKKNERDKFRDNQTMMMSKEDFHKESFSDNTMVIPRIKEEEYKKKDKKDFNNEQKDVFDKIEDKYQNLNNKRQGRNKRSGNRSNNKGKAFYRTTWFMWIMLFLLPPVGIIFTWLNRSLKRKTKKRLTLLFAIYFVLIVGMPTIKNTFGDVKDKFNFTLPIKQEETKPEEDKKYNDDITKPEPEQQENNKSNGNSTIKTEQQKPNNKPKNTEKPKEDKNENNNKPNNNVKPEENKPETNKPNTDNSNNKPNTGNNKPVDNNQDTNKPPQEPAPKPSDGSGNIEKPKQP